MYSPHPALEHNLLYDGPKRLWYSGPLFRHERPQKGRYREYHTFGAEALGFPGPDIDIELLVMVQRLWQRLGLTGITLELNSGRPNCSTPMRRAGCTPIRCGSWTARTRPCRK